MLASPQSFTPTPEGALAAVCLDYITEMRERRHPLPPKQWCSVVLPPSSLA